MTLLARYEVVFANDFMAGRTARPVPAGERNVSRIFVVGMQDLINQNKQVVEPSLTERLLDWCSTIAFAEVLIPNMRMSCCLISSCRVRLQGNDTVGPRQRQIPILKHDLERSQFRSVQDDRLRDDRNGPVPTVPVNMRKLGFEGFKIFEDVPKAISGSSRRMVPREIRHSPDLLNERFSNPVELLQGTLESD